VHRRLSLQLLEAQSTFDPATSWEDFLERLWSGCQQLAYDPPTDSGRLTASLERDPPMLDDHDEPGIPLRLVPWLERMQFQRSVTDTYRAQRPDAWPLFHDALYQALSAEFGLDCTWANRDPRSEDTRLDRPAPASDTAARPSPRTVRPGGPLGGVPRDRLGRSRPRADADSHDRAQRRRRRR
jgi:hypothetical protein